MNLAEVTTQSAFTFTVEKDGLKWNCSVGEAVGNDLFYHWGTHLNMHEDLWHVQWRHAIQMMHHSSVRAPNLWPYLILKSLLDQLTQLTPCLNTDIWVRMLAVSFF